MKYFSPSYWFKLWLLSAQLFNDQTKNTNAMLIDKNKDIKNWVNKNSTSLDSNFSQLNFTNSSIENMNTELINKTIKNIDQFNKTYLDLPRWDQNLTTIQDKYWKKKNKKRVKRYNQKLPIDPISQLGRMWCGLAVAEMILRYFNINVNTLLTETSLFEEHINYNYIPNRLMFFQRLLGFLMQTDNASGTEPANFLTILNRFISNRNLNDRRQYSVTSLLGGFTNESHQRFYNLVSGSLNANMPVAIAYTGTLPWDTEPSNHFMLINGVEGNPSNLMTLRYNIIDPDPSGPRPPNDESIIPSSYWVPLLFTSDNPSYIFSFEGTYFPPIEVDEEGFCEEEMDKKRKNLLNSENIIQKENCILKLFTVDNKEITQFKILDEHTQGGNLKAGTIYVGTTNGVYLVLNNGNFHKFDGLDFPITSIKLDRNGSAYVTNSKEEVYHLNLSGWGSKKLDKIQSSNLEKELKLYYYNNKDDKVLKLEPRLDHYHNSISPSINLERINPIDNYKKLEFLGDVYSNNWGLEVKWGSWIYDGNTGPDHHHPGDTYDLNYFMKTKDNRNNQFHDIIENNKNSISSSKKNDLQKFSDKDGAAALEVEQSFGLTWYWENPDYTLRVFGLQYCEWWASRASLECSMKMGSGVRLYNDDNDFSNLNRNFDNEKELNLYYDLKKNDFTYIHDWYYNHTGNKIIKTFNLSRTNPVDNFNRIEFLGDNENFKLSRVSWGNTPYYSSKKLNNFNNQSLYEIIKNYKFDETNQDKIADYTTMVLQPKTTKWWSNAWLEWSQSLGLTWYWEDNNYFLQVISSEYANDGGSLYGGSLFMGIGNGIRLYNDDVQDEGNADSWKNNEIINVINNEENIENITSTANIEASNNFDINDINYILNYQNQSLANVSTTNIPTI